MENSILFKFYSDAEAQTLVEEVTAPITISGSVPEMNDIISHSDIDYKVQEIKPEVKKDTSTGIGFTVYHVKSMNLKSLKEHSAERAAVLSRKIRAKYRS